MHIPKKLKVGFVYRDGTFDGKLAYIAPGDNNGGWKQEKSFENWRDKTIDPVIFENTPVTGLVLNKSLRRSSWYGSGRNVIRVHDPRGFEFEIRPENLLLLLLEGVCSHGSLEGEFIYGWTDSNVSVFPANSQIYLEALRSEKAEEEHSHELVKIGSLVRLKQCKEDFVYCGHLPWYEHLNGVQFGVPELKGKKHVFFNEKLQKFETRSSIATLRSKGIVATQDQIDSWVARCAGTSPIVKRYIKPIELDFTDDLHFSAQTHDGKFHEVSIYIHPDYVYVAQGRTCGDYSRLPDIPKAIQFVADNYQVVGEAYAVLKSGLHVPSKDIGECWSDGYLTTKGEFIDEDS